MRLRSHRCCGSGETCPPNTRCPNARPWKRSMTRAVSKPEQNNESPSPLGRAIPTAPDCLEEPRRFAPDLGPTGEQGVPKSPLRSGSGPAGGSGSGESEKSDAGKKAKKKPTRRRTIFLQRPKHYSRDMGFVKQVFANRPNGFSSAGKAPSTVDFSAVSFE